MYSFELLIMFNISSLSVQFNNVTWLERSNLSINFDPKYYGEGDEKKNIPEEQRQYQIVVRAHGGSQEIPEDSEKMIKFLETIVDKALEFGIENSKDIINAIYHK